MCDYCIIENHCTFDVIYEQNLIKINGMVLFENSSNLSINLFLANNPFKFQESKSIQLMASFDKLFI